MKYTKHTFHEPTGVYTVEDAHRLAKLIDINFSMIRLSEFLRGLNFEAEHKDSFDGIVSTALLDKAFAATVYKQLSQIPDYYTRLDHMKDEALKYWHLDETPPTKKPKTPRQERQEFSV